MQRVSVATGTLRHGVIEGSDEFALFKFIDEKVGAVHSIDQKHKKYASIEEN